MMMDDGWWVMDDGDDDDEDEDDDDDDFDILLKPCKKPQWLLVSCSMGAGNFDIFWNPVRNPNDFMVKFHMVCKSNMFWVYDVYIYFWCVCVFEAILYVLVDTLAT